MKSTSLVLLFASAGWLASCGGEPPAREAADLPSVAVSTVSVEEADWPSVYEAVGTVRARTAATLSAKVMGYVREVAVNAGDRIKAGQILVTLDSRDLDAGHRQAQAGLAAAKSATAEVESAIIAARAQLNLAEATFKRMQDLHEKKSITEQEFDEASAKLRMAEANHEIALSKKGQVNEQIHLAEEGVAAAAIVQSYAVIKAPFDGTVTQKMVEPGDLTAPGAPLLTVEQAGNFRLEAQLEESRLSLIRAGQEVEVELEAQGRVIPARVSEIVPAVDAASRAFLVKINLPNVPNLRSGVFGRARFAGEPKTVIAIPAAAVVSRGQVKSVYVVEQGSARNRLVTLGGGRDGQVEVLSGLTAGEKIVAMPPEEIADGSPVEVRP
jgi:RND family efflux transporter MFP subunit